jgi:hypothetical protein
MGDYIQTNKRRGGTDARGLANFSLQYLLTDYTDEEAQQFTPDEADLPGGIGHLRNTLGKVLNAAQLHVVQQLEDGVDGNAELACRGGMGDGTINVRQSLA